MTKHKNITVSSKHKNFRKNKTYFGQPPTGQCLDLFNPGVTVSNPASDKAFFHAL